MSLKAFLILLFLFGGCSPLKASVIDYLGFLPGKSDLRSSDLAYFQKSKYKAFWEIALQKSEKLTLFSFIPKQAYWIMELNDRAMTIWSEYQSCVGSFELARVNYILGNWICNGQNFSEKFQILKINLINGFETTQPEPHQSYYNHADGYEYTNGDGWRFPVMHPFMGQILMEYYAKLRVFSKDFVTRETSRPNIYGSRARTFTEYIRYCQMRNRRGCDRLIQGLEHAHKIYAILKKSDSRFCQSYGLYPNASFYLMYTGNSAFEHPMENGLVGLFTYGFVPEGSYGNCWRSALEVVEDYNVNLNYEDKMNILQHYSDLFNI